MGLSVLVVIATFGIYIYWYRMNKKLTEADPNVDLEMVDASTFNVLGVRGGTTVLGRSSSSSSTSSFHFKDRKHTIEEFDNDYDNDYNDNMTKRNNHSSYTPPQLTAMNSVLSSAMSTAMSAVNSTMTTIKSSTNEAYRKLNNKVGPIGGHDNNNNNNNNNDDIIYSPLNNDNDETKDTDEFEL